MWFHNSKKIVIDGIKFDSTIESQYYIYLKEQKGLWNIMDFAIQPKYLLITKFEKNWEKFRDMYYIADFLVIHKEWNFVVDIKWMPTEQSKIKRKLFCRKYDIPMKWLVKYKWEWISYFENIKRRAREKRNK